MRPAKPNCPEKEARGEEIVHLVNAGNRPFSIRWQGPVLGRKAEPSKGILGIPTKQAVLTVSPGFEKPIPQKVAWAVMGDPDLLPGQDRLPLEGSVKEWNHQVDRLREFHGYTLYTKYEETAEQASERLHGPNPSDPKGAKQLPYVDGAVYYNEMIDPASDWKFILDGNLYIKEWVEEFAASCNGPAKGAKLYSKKHDGGHERVLVGVGGQEVPMGKGQRSGDVGGEERPIKR